MGILTKLAVLGTAAAGGGLAFYKLADVKTQFELISAAGPIYRLMDAELTHVLGIEAAKWGMFPKETRPDPPVLKTKLWNKEFSNPIGLAAGFDKHAEVIEPMMRLGFGFVEIGSVTPQPQDGNAKPRVFRIKDLKATINRYGFNSLGADAVADNLILYERAVRNDPSAKTGLLGVNLGKNKMSKDAGSDYSIGLNKLGQFADYVVINISSPNTPGLRALQSKKELEELVVQVMGTRDRMRWGPSGPPPLVVKIAPDLQEEDMKDIAEVVLKHKVDGLIVSNTTITRPGSVANYPEAKEAGGLSGPPIMAMSTQVLSQMYKLTGEGKVPIIGCGGVASGDDAYKKIRAGASAVQIYTSMAYDGPVVLPRIKERLAELLVRDGFSCVADAVGADHRAPPAK